MKIGGESSEWPNVAKKSNICSRFNWFRSFYRFCCFLTASFYNRISRYNFAKCLCISVYFYQLSLQRTLSFKMTKQRKYHQRWKLPIWKAFFKLRCAPPFFPKMSRNVWAKKSKAKKREAKLRVKTFYLTFLTRNFATLRKILLEYPKMAERSEAY